MTTPAMTHIYITVKPGTVGLSMAIDRAAQCLGPGRVVHMEYAPLPDPSYTHTKENDNAWSALLAYAQAEAAAGRTPLEVIPQLAQMLEASGD